jgi:hypothetical protein
MTRVEDLLNRFLDDGLDANERSELENALHASSRAAEQLFDFYQQDRLLSVLLRPSQAPAVDAIIEGVLQEDRFVDAAMRQAQALDLERTLADRGKEPPVGEAKAQSQKRPAALSFSLRAQMPVVSAEQAKADRSWVEKVRTAKKAMFACHHLWSPRFGLSVALCLALVLGFGFWRLSAALSNVPILTEFAGQKNGIVVQRFGKILRVDARLKLQPGDLLTTSPTGAGLITFPHEQTRIRLTGRTQVTLLNLKQGKRFGLQQGRIEATVAHQPTRRPMVWETPQAQATVVGTELALQITEGTTRLEVVQGEVKLTSRQVGQSVLVTNSQYVVLDSGGQIRTKGSYAGRGTILYETWLNVAGNHVGRLTTSPAFQKRPDREEQLNQFAAPTNWGINYGSRFRGYLYPPTTGLYTFWITARETAQLWLSSDESSQAAQLIASLEQGVPLDQWDKYPWQKSALTYLESRRKYYVEVLHKADDQGGDHCSVAWQPPGWNRSVISGVFLSPSQNDAIPVKP